MGIGWRGAGSSPAIGCPIRSEENNCVTVKLANLTRGLASAVIMLARSSRAVMARSLHREFRRDMKVMVGVKVRESAAKRWEYSRAAPASALTLCTRTRLPLARSASSTTRSRSA